TTHELRGDALLAEFERASDAVNAASAFQESNSEFNQKLYGDIRPVVRIGISLGEIVVADSTLTGAGVVLAQRLEQLAKPGGVVIQGAIREALPSRLPFSYRLLGDQVLKGFDESTRAFLVELDEGEKISTPESSSSRSDVIGLANQSPVSYCSSADATSIAYADVGEGPPLVIAGFWMTHLEETWNDPILQPYLSQLAEDFKIIRYDQRGNGMSDWDNVDISFEKMVDDLEAVIDCHGFEKIAILGCSQAAAVSIAYTLRHPGKVLSLVLYGGYPRGRCQRGDAEAEAESKALVTLIRQSWGRDNPAIRQTMTSLFMPDATREEANWFNEFQKKCGPAENIARFREIFDNINVVDSLPRLDLPVLVIHSVGDSAAPISEGKLLASRIPGAKFVTFNSRSHVLSDKESEFPRSMQVIREFLKSN
ncbi:MAG: alpha/beta fold hydrolase, partial [Desulfobulbaceae bacterium]